MQSSSEKGKSRAHMLHMEAQIVFTRRLRVGDMAVASNGLEGCVVDVGPEINSPYVVEVQGSVHAIHESNPNEACANAHQVQTVNLFPHELALQACRRHSTHLGDHHEEGQVFEAIIPWHPHLAGRLLHVPAKSSVEAKHLGISDSPIFFHCPDSKSNIVLQVRFKCDQTSIVFPRLRPAPWHMAERHWRLGEQWGIREITGGDGSFKPSKKGSTTSVGDATIPCAVQTKCGCVRLVEQCRGGFFASICSVHVMEDQEHFFSFEIVHCVGNTATGMRVGISSVDGQQQWVLRMSDGRLCDATGCPLREPLSPQAQEQDLDDSDVLDEPALSLQGRLREPIVDKSDMPAMVQNTKVEVRLCCCPAL